MTKSTKFYGCFKLKNFGFDAILRDNSCWTIKWTFELQRIVGRMLNWPGTHTVSVRNRLRRLPVHGSLHRLLPASVPELALCKHTSAFGLRSSSYRRAVRYRRRFTVPSGLIWGSDFSDVTSLRSSGLKLHTLTPSAAPAAIAAPRAVVSGMDGFTGGNNR